MPHEPAPRPPTLLEALREQLGAEGRPPSRARLEAWIRAGAARVDGRTVRDPEQRLGPEVRLSFDPEEADGEAPAHGAPRGRRAEPAPGVLHADAQLVVVERTAFPASAGPAFTDAVAAALGRERLWLPKDPSGAGAGPVLLAGSDAARKALEAAIAEARVLETLLSVRTPVQAGPYEVVVERGVPGPDRPTTPFALLRREQAPVAAPPLGARHVVPPQRLALTLKHPRTNRRLCFEVSAAGPFLEALARLGMGGG